VESDAGRIVSGVDQRLRAIQEQLLQEVEHGDVF
jgi:flagellar biosynthesis/type III secretory pathway protein FliH